jgi:flagellar hook-basal body complex protein FliE
MSIPFGIIPSTITGLLAPGSSAGASAAPPESSFADAFATAVNQVESTQASAKTAAMDLLAGGKGDVHTVALEAQRAELSLELFQQVRNKFVSAYQEIMKMPM